MAGNAFSSLSTNSKVTVTSTATKIPASGTSGRSAVLIKNVGSDTIMLGGSSSVTYASGYPLAAGEALPLDMAGVNIYGICDTGASAEVRVLEGI